MGFRVHSLLFFQRKLFLRFQVDLDLLGDGASHFVLERQRIAQFALIAVAPQMPVVAGLDQLRRDSNLAP